MHTLHTPTLASVLRLPRVHLRTKMSSLLLAAAVLVGTVSTLLLGAAVVPADAAAAPWYGPWFAHKYSLWTSPQSTFKPVRLAVSADHVWVADQQNDCIALFDLSDLAHISVDAWYGAGTTGDALNDPSGLALSNDAQQLFIADTGNHRIVVVSTADWSVLQEIGGTQGSGDTQFSSPNDVDVWSGGMVAPAEAMLYVADTGNHRIVKYGFNTGTDQWEYTAKWGTQGAGVGQFSSPGGIALDHHQVKVWVADTGNHRLQVFEQDGTSPQTIGAAGSSAGRFSSPRDLAFIPSPLTLLVADEGNNRVQEWSIGTAGTLTATYRRSFGSYGLVGVAKMNHPQGVAVDKSQESEMYVADTLNRRMQLWRRDTVGPRTYAYRKVAVKRGRKARLKYKLSDSLSDRCTVEIRIYRRGVKKKTLSLGWRTTGGWRATTFTCKLRPGTYTWKVYAKDRAGNNQRSPIGTKTLVVTR